MKTRNFWKLLSVLQGTVLSCDSAVICTLKVFVPRTDVRVFFGGLGSVGGLGSSRGLFCGINL